MTLDEQIETLLAQAPGFWYLDACGVTRTERQIPALLHGTDQPPAGERLQLVLIGGLSGTQEDADAALAALHSYRTAPGLTQRYALSAVPCANPDGLALGAAPENGAGGNPGAAYPPPETATTTPTRKRTTSGAGSASRRPTSSSKSAPAKPRPGRALPSVWSFWSSSVPY